MKFHRKPPYFDHRMNELSRKILELGVIMFCAIAIWTLGNKNILEESALVGFDYSKD